MGCRHFTANHKCNFVDPTKEVRTQNVERMRRSAKWHTKKQRGTDRHHLESYLTEYFWGKYLVKNVFDESIIENNSGII